MARNTQLILQEETGICDVADPWGGSYMMESLTDELSEKAMCIIDEVEVAGGMTAYINSGMAKLRIEESATKKQGRIDSGQEVIVGVNKYRLDADQEREGRQEVLQIDNSAVRQKQINQLNELKRTRNMEDVLAAFPPSSFFESTGDAATVVTELNNSPKDSRRVLIHYTGAEPLHDVASAIRWAHPTDNVFTIALVPSPARFLRNEDVRKADVVAYTAPTRVVPPSDLQNDQPRSTQDLQKRN